MPPLRVIVVGAGAFGRNHLRVYREIEAAHPGLVHLAALVEPDPQRRDGLAARFGIPAFATLDHLLASDLAPGITAASVCVPTIHHAAVSASLLQAGIDVLIEKPFATSLAEADHLTSLAQDRGRILAVGHLERFNPAVTAALAALNKPMFFEAHRLSIFTPRSLDVDVVLDLMIHDLDVVLALTNSPVKEVRAVGLPILSPKVDIANVRVEFDSGCVANFTASRVSTEQVRKLRLFQPHQYLSLDFARQELLTISVDPAIAQLLGSLSPQQAATLAATFTSSLKPSSLNPSVLKGTGFSPSASRPPTPGALAPEAITTGAHPTPGLTLAKSNLPGAEPLRLELEDFLYAVRDRTQPRVPASAGRAALSLALDINHHIAAHTHRVGLH